MKRVPKSRIFELDFLRGLALILMCLDHLAVDLWMLPAWFPPADATMSRLSSWAGSVENSPIRTGAHYCFATLFLLLAGIGSSLTSHPWKRCGRIALGALVITAGTAAVQLFFHMECLILFGVLSAMAVGALVLCLLEQLPEKAVLPAATAAGIAMIVAGFCVRWYDPQVAYAMPDSILPVIFGTLRYGADWFPVFPCCGVICLGYVLGKLLYRDRQSRIPALRGKTCFLCAVGRYPLWIYLLHQPVFAGVLYLIFAK